MMRCCLVGLLAVVATTAVGCTDADPIRLSLDGDVVVGDALPPLDGALDAGFDDDTGVSDDASNTPDGATDAADAQMRSDLGLVGVPVDDAGATDSGIDPLCSAASTATVAESDLAAQAPALDGRVITVIGTATVGAVRCTSRSCSPEDPCCNDCTASVRVGEAVLVESPCFPMPGCTGTECGVVCRPPAPPLGGTAQYRGIIRVAPSLRLELIVVE